jgi:cyclic beta-1,2-glucan synthetase
MGFAALGRGDEAHELFALINPINHTATRAGVLRYKVEPYVAAADVYSVSPHVGRGGWTWYTGSAGWLYRAGIESILGLKVKGDQIEVAPCLPTTWPGFEIILTLRGTVYEIVVRNPDGVNRGVIALELDGVPQAVADGEAVIRLSDEVARRSIVVTLG